MMRRIHHVGIVVERLTDAYAFYRDVLGLPLVREAEIADQGVRAALLAAGESEIELLEPLGVDTPVGRFLAKRGEGSHHLCFETPDVADSLADLHARRAARRPHTAGRSWPGGSASCSRRPAGRARGAGHAGRPRRRELASPLRLKRLVIGSEDVRATAGVFQSLFGFGEVAINGGPRAMLAVGQHVPDGARPRGRRHRRHGRASFMAEDFSALTAALSRAGTPHLEGTGEVTVEPSVSHGVHLHISRYMFP